jgi:hypothetical protein
MATSLNLTQGNPDIASAYILTSYESTTGAFRAEGQTVMLNPSGDFLGMALQSFILTATIDSAGVASGGTLTVRGDYGGTDQLLFYSTDLVAFGFGAANKFEFVFTQDSVLGDHSLAAAGAQLGTIMTDVSGLHFAGDVPNFLNSFQSDQLTGMPDWGTGSADTFMIAVPLPTGALASGVGLAVVAVRRRRR